MTHDTPGDYSDRRWCERCRLSVDPSVGDDRLRCPACGADLGAVTD